jgi:3-methyladenine DNA glycosylase AlkD
MTFDEAMRTLESAGMAQNREVYPRHGVKGAMFGVSYATQRALAKKVKTDHELATRWWDTEHDRSGRCAFHHARQARISSHSHGAGPTLNVMPGGS